jgi:uncharacterized membrane protein YhaH (DUF805 family)
MEKQESEYNMFDWWKKVVFKNYANFNGRSRRAEYWNFVLVNFIIYFPGQILLFSTAGALDSEFIKGAGISFMLCFALAMFIPSLAVLVRRLHDINKSGWYILFYFIPLVGVILLLVWLFTDGDRYQNNYGDDPKNPGIEHELEFTGK